MNSNCALIILVQKVNIKMVKIELKKFTKLGNSDDKVEKEPLECGFSIG